ncbi:uncharacterized protein LODBEIA_P03860 [Lodderomyces beijingensis]|uniref:Uncharacterized protein n=1 Tax=Lodderomyces beijingensis TaxID=1775926 RepID=A0ABP0ZDB7_9ASCO
MKFLAIFTVAAVIQATIVPANTDLKAKRALLSGTQTKSSVEANAKRDAEAHSLEARFKNGELKKKEYVVPQLDVMV